MKEFLTSGQVGSIELDENRKLGKMITERWERLGMTEGLQGVMKENISMLFENQAKMMLREATDASNSGSFETVVFPIVRRVFSKLLANDIVSVQAMNLPVGKLFFMLPVTSQRTWSDTDITDGATASHKGLMGYERTDRRNGNTYNRFYLPDEVVNGVKYQKYVSGETWADLAATTYDAAVVEADGAKVRQATPEVTKYMEKTLYDLFYDDFLYDNSKGKIHIKVGKMTPMAFVNGKLSELGEVKAYADGSIRNVIYKVTGFSSYRHGKITGPDGNEMDTEAFLASLKVVAPEAGIVPSATATAATYSSFAANEPIHFRLVTQQYGHGIVDYKDVCDAEGALYIDVDFAKPCKQRGETIDGYIGIEPVATVSALPQLKCAWCQYDSLELETEMGEVSFQLSSVVVSTEERKLRATWSPEMAQDVNAFHAIDTEAELTALLSEQIAAEIDREILRDLRKAAPWKLRWDVNGWRRMAGFSTNYTQKDWNQELITKVNQISAQINKATLHGGADYLVVSAEISALLNNLEYFHVSDASAESDQYNMGIERVGSLEGRYQVYMDPMAPYWSLIMGHKGKSLLDAGYIYAPYIPLQLTPTIPNPMNFAPVKGIMTRYAKKCVNNRFFGAVVVDGLVHFDTAELR